jgi:hypothetical protein
VSLQALPDALWLWLAIAGLGLFHGINPAMGWLFAVALGLNRRSERVLWLALLPIGLGHALAVAVILILVLALGLVLEPGLLRPLAAALLFAWAGWHALYGRRHKLRFGMQVGLGGLFVWSFLMANAHGAGLMLIPAVIPALPRSPFTPARCWRQSGSSRSWFTDGLASRSCGAAGSISIWCGPSRWQSVGSSCS